MLSLAENDSPVEGVDVLVEDPPFRRALAEAPAHEDLRALLPPLPLARRARARAFAAHHAPAAATFAVVVLLLLLVVVVDGHDGHAAVAGPAHVLLALQAHRHEVCRASEASFELGYTDFRG